MNQQKQVNCKCIILLFEDGCKNVFNKISISNPESGHEGHVGFFCDFSSLNKFTEFNLNKRAAPKLHIDLSVFSLQLISFRFWF